MTHTDLAEMVLDAQRIREESWSTTGKHYTLSHNVAVHKANMARLVPLPEEIEFVVELLNTTAWNDAQDWAKSLMTDTVQS